MNTSTDQDAPDVRYAEYVLGVLDAPSRAQIKQEIEHDSRAASIVAQWEQRLIPLTEDLTPIAPADYVWVRIRDALGLMSRASLPKSHAAVPVGTGDGWWNNLALWRWLSMGATAVAAICVVLLMQARPPLAAPAPAAVTAPAPASASAGYMAARIQQDNGVAGWTALMDLQNHRMIVVPASPAALPKGRAPELWLIPPGGKPMSVAVIARDKPTAVTLSPSLFAQLGPKALLAVSVEPLGGSPSGQPTGPVIAKGPIGSA